MRALIKNDHGQSLIETALILGFTTGAVFAVLKMALTFILTLCVDDLLESYVLCSAYNNPPQCQAILKEKLTLINLQLVSVTSDHTFKSDKSDFTVARLTVATRFNKNIQRSRDYVKK